jgi:ArsR family transcriptional regulator
MSSKSAKKDLFAQIGAVAKALGHGHRLELLELLAQRERHVEALAGLCGLSVANASQHLQRLRRIGLVAAEKNGHQVVYRLADEAVLDLLGALRQIAVRHSAEARRVVDGYYRGRDTLEPVTRAALLARMDRGQAVVLDVRPPEEFAARHLPGAINIPLGDLEVRWPELPREQEIVAYCRGPYCVWAFEAVAALRGHGYRARRLEDGFPEWKHAGLAVETEPEPESKPRPISVSEPEPANSG